MIKTNIPLKADILTAICRCCWQTVTEPIKSIHIVSDKEICFIQHKKTIQMYKIYITTETHKIKTIYVNKDI